MVSFGAFRAVDGTPVYLQIIRYIKRGAVAGTIRDGDELPSRRVIESRTGAKSCMPLPEKTLAALRQELLSEELRNAARTLRQMGITKEDALRLLAQAWEEEET